MTHDPLIPGAPRPVDPTSVGASPSPNQGTQPTQGAAFKALLEKLESKTRGLHEATEALTEPAQLSDAVDHARTSLDDAVSLGDQLLEAYRAARHEQGEGGNVVTVTIQNTCDGAELLMRAVLREGAPIAGEYPLVFDAGFDGRIVTADADGAVRSTCAFLERELALNALRFKAGFVGSVATEPGYRRKGLASNVLRAAEEELTAAGCVFSILWADEPEYYATRGYVPIGTEFNYFVTPESATKLPEPGGVRESRRADTECIHELYESHTSRVVRALDETRALLDGPGIETLVLERDGAVVAFSCMGRGADMQSVVHEWGGDAESVMALLRAHIDRKDDAQPVFLLVSPDDRAIGEYFEASGIPGACGVLGMGKMLDAEAACAVFAEALGEGEVVVAERSEPTLIVRGPAGEIPLTGPNTLMTLFAPKGSRDLISVVEQATGLSLANLPLTPFAWGLDSI